jgi:hypothetical protein
MGMCAIEGLCVCVHIFVCNVDLCMCAGMCVQHEFACICVCMCNMGVMWGGVDTNT